MPRPRRVHDHELHAEARAAFLAGGTAATLAEIAARLGVSQAALIHRAGSKEALLVAALAPRPLPALAALRLGPDAAAPVGPQLVAALAPIGPFLRELAPSLLVLRQAGIAWERAAPPGEPPTVSLRRALAEFLARANPRLARPIAPAVIADALLGALEARAFNGFLGGAAFTPGDDEAHLRALVDALVPEVP